MRLKGSERHPTATVLIPTYNRADLLARTLRSLCDIEETEGAFEVIVSDDGSSDNTVSIVQRFERRLDIKYIYVRDDGFRLSRARNLGIALAEGEFCILLDCGLLVFPGFIKGHIEAHEAYPCSYVIGYVYGMNSEPPVKARLLDLLTIGEDLGSVSFVAIENDSDFCDTREPCYLACNDDLSKLYAPWAVAWTSNVSIPTEIAIKVGGFDEFYKSWGGEDVDFALAVVQSGAEIRLARAAAAVHIPHLEPEDGEETYTSNKLYLHNKYNLPETEKLINTPSVELNISHVERSK